jgi:DNA-binding NarL/FixJ family response regulator
MGYRMVIDTQPDLEIVGEASNGLEAVDARPSARIIILTTEVAAF